MLASLILRFDLSETVITCFGQRCKLAWL